MGKPQAMPSENVVSKNKVSEASFISMRAALNRAETLDFLRISQDIVNRIVMMLFLVLLLGHGDIPYQGRIVVYFLVVLFCAMWQISKIRFYDIVSQIEDNYITGAQNAFGGSVETKWEQLLIILGSRATSRRDIAAMEKVLQLEPAIWGVLAVLAISLGWSWSA